MKLRFGSVSSGIGGDTVAWEPLGWEPVFCSEIAAFPCAVLAHRFPDVPNLGDYTAEDFCDRARACGPIDVFAGGTPCQAFSVAGKRGSLSDERGNLTLRFVEIVHELDPAIVVWENVPGVLSTKDNAFGCFLSGLVGESEPLRSGLVRGRWPNAGMVIGPRRAVAWRVFDAQYFGLAQRRRRVCVVSFHIRDGLNPGAVLFEPESLPRHSPPSREAGAGIAGDAEGGAQGRCRSVANSLRARANASHREDTDTYVTEASTGELSHCLNAGGVGRQDYETEMLITHSLRGEGFNASEDGTGRGTPLVPVGFDARQDPNATVNLSEPLDGSLPGKAVAYQCHGSNVGPMGTLRAWNGNEGGGVSFMATPRLCVRRLTPRECERLQGFPDDWTLIPWRKKPAEDCPDGPRYKGLGNAWATNVFNWIGRRIEAVLEAVHTRD